MKKIKYNRPELKHVKEIKEGQIVKIRSWKSMEAQYGLNENGNIDCPTDTFVRSMKSLCKSKVKLFTDYYGSIYCTDTKGEDWFISKYMVKKIVKDVNV